MMNEQRIRKVEDRLVIAIPEEEIARLGLSEGQLVGFVILVVEGRPVLRPELQEAFDGSWERNEAGY
jgi:hypothetical protein